MKTKSTFQNLFNPKSIAIVGASEKEGKVGTVIAQNLLSLGWKGEVFLVNPQYDRLYDKTCYKDLGAIEKSIDLAIISVPAKFVADVIRDSADKIKNFVIISAGFTEMGDEGKKREKEIEKLAEQFELNILGPNCLGFIVPSLKLNASFAGGMPEAGNISFISQSGALAVGLMDMASKRNLSFSSIISVGNKMQIDETLLLEYLGQDKNTKVIAMYLEGIKNGEAFIQAAQKVSAAKPIVVLKAGKSSKSQEAIASHTGALAGSDMVMDKVFEKAGILRAENLEDFFDLISFISKNDFPKSEKVAVITNAGGAGVLSADAFEGKVIKLADFSEAQRKQMQAILPEESSVRNPIDVLGDAHEDRYQSILELLEGNSEVSSIICLLTPQDQTPVMNIAEKIAQFKKGTKKIVATSFVGGDRVQDAVDYLRKNGVENFSYPERAVKALDDYFNYHARIAGIKVSQPNGKINSKRQSAASRIIDHARVEGRTALYFNEAAEIMAMYGIKAAQSKTVLPKQSNCEPMIFPVVVKIDSDKVLHKSDRQALIAGVSDQEQLESAMKNLRKNFPNERIIIQQMQDKGMEIILGIKRDPIFGGIIVYGLGGIYTEIFKKVGFILPPLDKAAIEKELLEGQLGFLLRETRGQKPYDIKELAGILSGMIEFSNEMVQVKECDINPLFIYNDGKAACAVDIKIII
jgi:acetyl coenzyme A synthetase (ADP forming)-like protein